MPTQVLDGIALDDSDDFGDDDRVNRLARRRVVRRRRDPQ
jgi:hypothetical protein